MNFFIKKHAYLLAILLFSFLPFITTFATTLYPYTQDGWTHLAREGAFFKALKDGQIPVRWAGDLNYGYGMPLFNFAFHFPYIVASSFIFLGFGLVDAYKLTVLSSFLLSGISMYLFASEFFKDKKKAVLAAVSYQFFPFHLVDLLVRGSIGELFAFAHLPLLLYGATLFWRKKNRFGILIVALSTAFLLLSHLATGGIFLIMAIIFVLLFGKDRKSRWYFLMAVILGLLLSAYYVLPAIFEHKYTYGDLFAQNLYKQHFANLSTFFIPNFFNIKSLRIGDVPIQIGLFSILALFLSVIIFFQEKSKEAKKLFLFCFFFFTASLFLTQQVSSFFWEKMPLFTQFQFPWRFLSIMGFVLSLLSVSFLSIPFFQKKIGFLVLIFGIVFSTIWYWTPQLGFIKINEVDYWNYPLNTTYFGETDVIWSAGPAGSYPKNRIDVIGGKATITDFVKKSNLHTFTLQGETKSQLVDHTQYFPGWRVFVDNNEVPVQFQDEHWRGQITFFVPKGKYNVVISFGETAIRIFSDLLSLLTIIFLFLFCLFDPKILKRFFL
ncbi:MAG: hypothetical protein HYV37_01995 [Candidatus Levyibacteriota bacterium]|nr:MAG: hypothetical protein HYV37_01995 [Candidatus Levybacteria bacterium]